MILNGLMLWVSSTIKLASRLCSTRQMPWPFLLGTWTLTRAISERQSEVEKRRFVVSRLPPWGKAVHLDDLIDTRTQELLWSYLLKKELTMITARETAKAAVASSPSAGAPLHLMGQPFPGQLHPGAHFLQSMSTEAEPMLQRLMHCQCEVDRVMDALTVVGDVDGLGSGLQDPRSRKILQDFADFNASHGGFDAGLHVLPEGYTRIQGTCRGCGIVGHKNEHYDALASAEELQGQHYSTWPRQVAVDAQTKNAGPVARGAGGNHRHGRSDERGLSFGGPPPAHRYTYHEAPMGPPPPYQAAAIGPPSHAVRGEQAYRGPPPPYQAAAIEPPSHAVRGEQAYCALPQLLPLREDGADMHMKAAGDELSSP